MAEGIIDCAHCPKTLEARSLLRNQNGIRYCFDCPLALRPSRFEALLKRGAAGAPAIRSCRRSRKAGLA